MKINSEIQTGSSEQKLALPAKVVTSEKKNVFGVIIDMLGMPSKKNLPDSASEVSYTVSDPIMKNKSEIDENPTPSYQVIQLEEDPREQENTVSLIPKIKGSKLEVTATHAEQENTVPLTSNIKGSKLEVTENLEAASERSRVANVKSIVQSQGPHGEAGEVVTDEQRSSPNVFLSAKLIDKKKNNEDKWNEITGPNLKKISGDKNQKSNSQKLLKLEATSLGTLDPKAEIAERPLLSNVESNVEKFVPHEKSFQNGRVESLVKNRLNSFMDTESISDYQQANRSNNLPLQHDNNTSNKVSDDRAHENIHTNDRNWANKFIQQLHINVIHGKTNSINLYLHPMSLGNLKVNLRRAGDKIEISISTQTKAAHKLLTDSRSKLAMLFETSGAKLDSLKFLMDTDAFSLGANDQKENKSGKYFGEGKKAGLARNDEKDVALDTDEVSLINKKNNRLVIYA